MVIHLHWLFQEKKTKNISFFFQAARSITRNWTGLTNFHENLLTVCHAEYFQFGFNEQFIELIDSQQTIRYNRSVLLVKHIRSTTHLFCKLHIDTLVVGIRVQTLINESIRFCSKRTSFWIFNLEFPSPLLSDKYLKRNDYLQMRTYERDIYKIAFEGRRNVSLCQQSFS